MNELMNVPRHQCQIGVIVLSTAGFWRNVVDFHIAQQQRLFANRTFSSLGNIKGNTVVVQFSALPLYGMLHELLQDGRADCLLKLVDFTSPLFGIITYLLWKAHRRHRFDPIYGKKCQSCYIKYLPGKITVELLKRLTSQAGFTAMAFRSA